MKNWKRKLTKLFNKQLLNLVKIEEQNQAIVYYIGKILAWVLNFVSDLKAQKYFKPNYWLLEYMSK